MKYGSFKARCDLAQQCLPDAPYRDALAKLHGEMLEEIDGLYKKMNDYAALARSRGGMHRELSQAHKSGAAMVDALHACLDYGAMTGDEWVSDKARAAITQSGMSQ